MERRENLFKIKFIIHVDEKRKGGGSSSFLFGNKNSTYIYIGLIRIETSLPDTGPPSPRSRVSETSNQKSRLWWVTLFHCMGSFLGEVQHKV